VRLGSVIRSVVRLCDIINAYIGNVSGIYYKKIISI